MSAVALLSDVSQLSLLDKKPPSKGLPALIRIVGDPSIPHSSDPIPVVDIFDAHQEEAFTLESFYELIMMATNANKDFLLARVMTVDGDLPFFSYYAAHQINKVIFKTEPDKNLLHRMRAMNPLNNMYIYGNVLYYRISAASVTAAFNSAKIIQSAKLISGSHKENIDPNNGEQVVLDFTYFATDDDFLTESCVRQIFKDNAISDEDRYLFNINSHSEHVISIPPDPEELSLFELFCSRSRQTQFKRTFLSLIALALLFLSITSFSVGHKVTGLLSLGCLFFFMYFLSRT